MKLGRVLISVWDKKGLGPFAGELSRLGAEIVSSGGTFAFLRDEGIPVISVESVTGFPEMLDGRVKTLHPAIHGAILARRENGQDMKTLAEASIVPIDMVVVNLYPFDLMKEKERNDRKLAEFIDIGGPTLLRAAAKNYPDVIPVCDPADYGAIAAGLAENGDISGADRRRLAAKVFALISAYDASVACWLDSI